MPPDSIEITPVTHPLNGTVTVPGSKSITNRAMLLAAMASGCSILRSVLVSDDTQRMAAALAALGFAIAVDEADRCITIEGRGGAIPAPSANLDAGGAGTAMRFLAGFLTLGRGRYRLDGNARMRQRPIGALIDTLRRLGVNAVSELDNGCPPILIDTSSVPFDRRRSHYRREPLLAIRLGPAAAATTMARRPPAQRQRRHRTAVHRDDAAR